MTHNRGFPSLRCLVAHMHTHTHMPSHTHTILFNKINKIPFQQWLGLVMSCSLNACCGNHKNELLQFYCINHMWLNVTKLKLKPMSRLRMFGWEIKTDEELRHDQRSDSSRLTVISHICYTLRCQWCFARCDTSACRHVVLLISH